MGLMVVLLGVLSYDVFLVFPLVIEQLWGYQMALGMEDHWGVETPQIHHCQPTSCHPCYPSLWKKCNQQSIVVTGYVHAGVTSETKIQCSSVTEIFPFKSDQDSLVELIWIVLRPILVYQNVVSKGTWERETQCQGISSGNWESRVHCKPARVGSQVLLQ